MASSSKEAQKRDAYNTAVFNFDWDTLQRKSWHAYQQYTDKTWNDKVIKDYEHSLKVSAWQDAAAIRHFKYANQREAHNASVKAYNKQLDYNELAEKISLNDSTRKYNERLTEIGFQNEDLLMNFNHTKLAKGLSLRELQEQKNLKSKAIAIGLRDAVDEANLNASRSLLELDKAKADAARKGVDLTIESLHQQGKVRAMGRTGRSARKTLQ